MEPTQNEHLKLWQLYLACSKKKKTRAFLYKILNVLVRRRNKNSRRIMVRPNNQLPDNLPQLQNLIKRDPESYSDEFHTQYEHFLSLLEIFALNPGEENKSLDEIVMFIAQVAQCYPQVCQQFPKHLTDLLRTSATVLDPAMRNSFVKALILLRNKNLVPALDILELFFQLLRCQDKNLRTFLQTHIVTDIKNMNAKHKDMKLNSVK